MKTIEYRVAYNGVLNANGSVSGEPSREIIRVRARDINSGFGKALKLAREPLGNGSKREIATVELWAVR